MTLILAFICSLHKGSLLADANAHKPHTIANYTCLHVTHCTQSVAHLVGVEPSTLHRCAFENSHMQTRTHAQSRTHTHTKSADPTRAASAALTILFALAAAGWRGGVG